LKSSALCKRSRDEGKLGGFLTKLGAQSKFSDHPACCYQKESSENKTSTRLWIARPGEDDSANEEEKTGNSKAD